MAATRYAVGMSNQSPVEPPVEPMLAKLSTELPTDSDLLYEPKWDGFRTIIFRTATTSTSRAAI
ncbi:MAG: hypothetical protein QM736_01850 [Vicinamibacterales bacterium]